MNKRPALAPYLIPRLQDLIYIFFFYLVLILGTNLFRDGDPGRHITFGRYILATFTLPQTDIYAYTTRDVFLPPYEWLSQITFGAAYNLIGLSGVVLVIAFLIAATLTLVYAEMLRREIPSLIAFAFTFWVAVLTMFHWLARPHIFSLLFLAIFTPRLTRLAQGQAVAWWQFPIIMLIWANTHGAFIFAFVIWFALIAGNIWESWRLRQNLNNPILRKLILTAVVSFAATLLNPAGWGLWKFATDFIGNSYLIEIASETRSVGFHGLSGWIMLLTIGSILIILSRSDQKRPMAESFLLAGWMMLGLYGGRNVPQFAVVAMPLIAEHAKSSLEWMPRLKHLQTQIAALESQLRGRAWSVIATILFVALLASGVKMDAARQGYHFNDVEFPVEAIDWLTENPQQGHLFNYFPWGGYMIYRLWPEYPLFIDGQMIYVETLVRDYEQILHTNAGWQEKLNQYDIQWAIIPPETRLATTLAQDPAWTLLHADKTAIIYRRARP